MKVGKATFALMGSAILGLAAPAGAASLTQWARAGHPYYWGEDAFFEGQTDSNGFGMWVCGKSQQAWWSTPIPLDGDAATMSAVQRVRPGNYVNSNLVVYDSAGSFYSQSGATTSTNLGSASLPSTAGFANVESMPLLSTSNFKFGCLIGIRIIQ